MKKVQIWSKTSTSGPKELSSNQFVGASRGSRQTAATASVTPGGVGPASRGAKRPGSKEKGRAASRGLVRSLRSRTAEAGPRKREMREAGAESGGGARRAPDEIMIAAEDQKGEPQAQGSSLEGAEPSTQEYAQMSRYHARLDSKAQSKRSSDSTAALHAVDTQEASRRRPASGEQSPRELSMKSAMEPNSDRFRLISQIKDDFEQLKKQMVLDGGVKAGLPAEQRKSCRQLPTKNLAMFASDYLGGSSAQSHLDTNKAQSQLASYDIGARMYRRSKRSRLQHLSNQQLSIVSQFEKNEDEFHQLLGSTQGLHPQQLLDCSARNSQKLGRGIPLQEGGSAFANSNIVDNFRRSRAGATNLDDSLDCFDAALNVGQFQNPALSQQQTGQSWALDSGSEPFRHRPAPRAAEGERPLSVLRSRSKERAFIAETAVRKLVAAQTRAQKAARRQQRARGATADDQRAVTAGGLPGLANSDQLYARSPGPAMAQFVHDPWSGLPQDLDAQTNMLVATQPPNRNHHRLDQSNGTQTRYRERNQKVIIPDIPLPEQKPGSKQSQALIRCNPLSVGFGENQTAQAGADQALVGNLKSGPDAEGQHEYRSNPAVAPEERPGNYVIANAGTANMFTHSVMARAKQRGFLHRVAKQRSALTQGATPKHIKVEKMEADKPQAGTSKAKEQKQEPDIPAKLQTLGLARLSPVLSPSRSNQSPENRKSQRMKAIVQFPSGKQTAENSSPLLTKRRRITRSPGQKKQRPFATSKSAMQFMSNTPLTNLDVETYQQAALGKQEREKDAKQQQMLKFEQLLGGVLTRSPAGVRTSHSKVRAILFDDGNDCGGPEAAASGGISRVSSLIERNRMASKWAALGRDARMRSPPDGELPSDRAPGILRGREISPAGGRTPAEQEEFDRALRELLLRYAQERHKENRKRKLTNAVSKVKSMRVERERARQGQQSSSQPRSPLSGSGDDSGAAGALGGLRNFHAALNIKNLRANLQLAMIKQQGVAIKQLAHDLARHVVADTRKTHQHLSLAHISFPAKREARLRQSRSVHLIEGYPAYFVLRLNLAEFRADKQTKWPLRFWIMSGKDADQAASELEVHRHQQQLAARLKETVCWISSKNRLPTADNHDRVLKGLPRAFAFGSEELFRSSDKEVTEATVYLGFSFGELEEHHDHVDFEKRTLEFSIGVQYSHHLCPEQIQAARRGKLETALDEDAALAALRAKFSKAYDDMSPSERRRYDGRRALLIENDLATWYMDSMSAKAIERRKRSASALAKKLQQDNRRAEIGCCDHTGAGTKKAATGAGKEEHTFNHIAEVVEALPTLTQNTQPSLDKVQGEATRPLQVYSPESAPDDRRANVKVQLVPEADKRFIRQNREHPLKLNLSLAQKKKLEQVLVNKYNNHNVPDQQRLRSPENVEGSKQYNLGAEAKLKETFGRLTSVERVQLAAALKIDVDDLNLADTSESGSPLGLGYLGGGSSIINVEQQQVQHYEEHSRLRQQQEASSPNSAGGYADGYEFQEAGSALTKAFHDLETLRHLRQLSTGQDALVAREAREEQQQADLAAQMSRWARYREHRLEAQDGVIQLVKARAHRRVLSGLLALRRVLKAIDMHVQRWRADNKRALLRGAVAARATKGFRRCYCSQFGAVLEERQQRVVQRHLAFLAMTQQNFEEQRARELVRALMERQYVYSSLRTGASRLRAQAVHVQRAFATSQANLQARRELLSTMFSRNLEWLLDLYRQKVARLASSKPKGAAAREVLEQYVGVYTTLRRLWRYRNRAGRLGAHPRAFLEASNVKASSAGLNGDRPGSSGAGWGSDSSELGLPGQGAAKGKRKAGQKRDAPKGALSPAARLALEDAQLQRAEERKVRAKAADELANTFIDTIIQRRLLQFTISFMLWRYRQYARHQLAGAGIHDKLGDLMRKQQDVRLKLPRLKAELQRHDELLLGGTQQIETDDTFSLKHLTPAPTAHAPGQQPGQQQTRPAKATQDVKDASTKSPQAKEQTQKETQPAQTKAAETPNRQPPAVAVPSAPRRTALERSLKMMDDIDAVTTLQAELMTVEEEQRGFPAFLFSFSREETHRAIWKCASVFVGQHWVVEESPTKTRKGRQSRAATDSTGLRVTSPRAGDRVSSGRSRASSAPRRDDSNLQSPQSGASSQALAKKAKNSKK